MVGLVTAEELSEIEHKKEPPPPRSTSLSPIRKSLSRSASGEYSQRTGRWNETPKVLSRSRSLRRPTPLSAIVPNHLFCVDEKEREMWVRFSKFFFFCNKRNPIFRDLFQILQVLCQILKTENINEIQSWLASSSSNGLLYFSFYFCIHSTF